jgi:hypothetical protein
MVGVAGWVTVIVVNVKKLKRRVRMLEARVVALESAQYVYPSAEHVVDFDARDEWRKVVADYDTGVVWEDEDDGWSTQSGPCGYL